MEVVATDGKCLSLYEQNLKEPTNLNLKFIVPIKTIQELNRNLKEEGEVLFTIGSNQVLFELNGVVIISRLIEGEFPDYRQVIPSVSENKFIVERISFLSALQRASLLSTPDYQAVKFQLLKNKLILSKSTPDIGESYEELPVKYQGKELVIGFNPYYLINVLKNLEDQEVSFELTEPQKPAVLRRQNYLYIVSPMHLG
ncbi:MAG: DNA polymerase III subunit beta [Candidatus Omnitrophica bacterium]|nr:DNA polymerase III subunit beta [Candidatus Omnitrophota bacterium]